MGSANGAATLLTIAQHQTQTIAHGVVVVAPCDRGHLRNLRYLLDVQRVMWYNAGRLTDSFRAGMGI